MNSMKKILIPTDFSENAWSSLIYAVNMFRKVECTFFLLHTIIMRESSITNFSNNKLNTSKEKANNELIKLKKNAENIKLNPNHKFEIILSFYHLDDAINFTSDKHEIDFTIIGTKGANNTIESILGSNTTRVIKNIKQIPTIVVPNEYQFKGLNRIVMLSDLNHTMDDTLLVPVKKLSEDNNSKLSLLHLSKTEKLTDNQTEELKSLETILSKYNFSFHQISNYTNKAQYVNEFIEEVSANMLVLIYYRNTVLEKYFKKSLTTTMCQNLKTPMLILPNKN
ncbi:MAG: universal stress protein [Kordia sp.]|nr:MAG: universal stress protein [Kordia sp.]